MRTDETLHPDGRKFRLHGRLALGIFVIGFLLMIRQMIYDDEPGAIPLLLVLSGLVWFFTNRARARALEKRGG